MKAAAPVVGGENIGFSDCDQRKAEQAAQSLGATVYQSNASAVSHSDFVFLAVKPQVLGELLNEIAPALQTRLSNKEPTILVSMAAGWSIDKIQTTLNIPAHFAAFSRFADRYAYRQPIIRIMPNTPVLIGQGIIAVTAAPEVPEPRVAELQQILALSGIVDRVDEAILDAVTALSGSGPAYAYLFIEALADGGVLVGLSAERALRYAVQTVLGSATMLKETGTHPALLKNIVASPGGTTIAGLAALEKGALRGTIIAAVEAAFKRAQELS
jgi:pyrroline-5-carboxylate reductase